jgi:hypothetical protein
VVHEIEERAERFAKRFGLVHRAMGLGCRVFPRRPPGTRAERESETATARANPYTPILFKLKHTCAIYFCI